jgi:hypothetical protein
MNTKPPYSLTQDVNGDASPHILLGLIGAACLLIMCVSAFIYGLSHVIQSGAIIMQILWLLTTMVGVLLGLTTFQRPRGGNNG